MNADISQRLPLPAYDRDLSLQELLKGIDHGELARSLGSLLDAPFRLVAADGSVLLGEALDASADRVPVCADMELVGYLEVQADAGERLPAAAHLIEIILRSAARYMMASDLHLSVVQSDFDKLEKEHQALMESEARYKQLAESLDRRVKAQVKTIESAQRRLYQAEKMASVGQLAAGVAHEINNPIGFIRSNLTTAQSYVRTIASFSEKSAIGSGDGEVHALLNESDMHFVLEDFEALLRESIDGTERVARIVKDLKGFSNVDRSEEEIIDINECIRGVCNLARPDIEKRAHLVLELKMLPLTRCQPGYLGQALLNLLLNAGKAIEQGGRICVTTFAEDKWIVIRVSDNGKGMEEDVLQRAFDPFFSTGTVGQGAGLGLTVARDIVVAHKGEITIDSRIGRGTRVTIKLPVVAT